MPGSIFDVKDYGAVGDGVANDSPAFQCALDAIAGLSKTARPGFPNNAHIEITDPSGAMLWIPRGQYRLTEPLRLNRQIVVQGVGAGNSQLRFPVGVDGLVVESVYTSAPEGDSVDANGAPLPDAHGSGSGSVIRDIGIIGGSAFGRSNPPHPAINEDDPVTALPIHHTGHPIQTGNGIVLCGTAMIEDCVIQNFHYDGVHVETIDSVGDFVDEAGAPYSGPSAGRNATTKNANGWQVRNCFVYGNGRHGIYTAGTNSNAGIVFGGTMQNNAGWAVYDRSFLGNNYFGCIAEANGHFSTDALAIVADATAPGELFAGTADAGAFKSGNNAEYWAAVNLGLRDFELLPRVQTLAVEPRGPYNTLYLGTSGGRIIDGTNPDPQNPLQRVVFQSKDAGSTWLGVGTSRNGLTSAIVRALAVHVPATPPYTLYAGTTDGGVFKGVVTPVPGLQTPDTITWSAVNAGLANQVVQALAIEPVTSPAVLYAGTQGGGVFKSTNAGASWSATGLQTGDVVALLIDPATTNTVYAATTDGGVFKSTDGGATWTPANNGLVDGGPITDVRALAMAPSSPAVLYAGANGHGIFKSTDGAASWSAVPDSNALGPPGTIVQSIPISSAIPSILYVGTNGGLFAGDQSNGRWTPYQPFYRGSYKTTSRIAGNVFVGCYAEGDQVYGGELAYPTIMLGGVDGGGFNFNSDAGLIVTTSASGQGVIGLPIRSPIHNRVRTIRGAGPNAPLAIDTQDSVIFADATIQDTRLQLPRINFGNTKIPGQQFTIKRIDNNANRIVVWRVPDAPVDGQTANTDFFLVPVANVDYATKEFSSVTLMAGADDWRVVSQA